MKKVLITNFEIVQFAGSEINCVTIAERLKKLGYEVYIAALEFGSPIYEVIKNDFDNTINLLENDFDFSQIEFDIVWVHHSFLLDWLIFEKGLRAKKIITSSLSPKEPFESAPIYANELCFSLANSQETYEKLTKEENVKNVYLLENYSFQSYFEQNIEVKKLEKIAVVSNHIPKEEMEAIQKLSEKGYQVDIYGLSGKQVLITDEILKDYDCIVTIGKTVQYAMSLKIPVYIYDIHGGDGYLTMETMELNRTHNFSGRGFEKKDANKIVKEIIENFQTALNQLEEIKDYAFKNFCFETKIDEVLQRLENCEEVDIEKIRQKYGQYTRNLLVSKRVAEHFERRKQEALRKQTIEFYQIKKQELNEKQREIDNRGYLLGEKDRIIETLEEQIKQKDEAIYAIKNSRSWRYTRFFRKNKD